MSDEDATIESRLTEQEYFEPPESFVEQANAADPAIYDRFEEFPVDRIVDDERMSQGASRSIVRMLSVNNAVLNFMAVEQALKTLGHRDH